VQGIGDLSLLGENNDNPRASPPGRKTAIHFLRVTQRDSRWSLELGASLDLGSWFLDLFCAFLTTVKQPHGQFPIFSSSFEPSWLWK
jgi:hypothetical protein